MNTFTFNGHTSDEFGIRIERMPVLNRPARKFRAASVPGRNGNIYEFEDAWEEIIQPYEIFAGGMNNGDAVSSFADIMEWLHSANGYAVLSDTYDSTHYRMAAFVDSADIESMWHTWGRMVVNFRCRPERYLTGQTSAITSGTVINNTTNHIAKPTITLTGGGACTLIGMQGRQAVPSSPSQTDINDISYLSSSRYYKGMLHSTTPNVTPTATTGNVINVSFDDTTGTASFSASVKYYGIGIPMRVAPNSTYSVSCACDTTASRVAVLFYGGRYLKRQVYTEGESSYSLTFTTPSDCNYILIEFISTAIASATFSNIMVNIGAPKTFRAYIAPYTLTFTIGDVSLQTTAQGFNSIEIDCETENIKRNGVDDNLNTQILDPYGNISENFLRLEKGNNTVTFSGTDIQSVTIDKRFWNL